MYGALIDFCRDKPLRTNQRAWRLESARGDNADAEDGLSRAVTKSDDAAKDTSVDETVGMTW